MPIARGISHPVTLQFEGRAPVVEKIYRALVTRSRRFGPVGEEGKQTGIHLMAKTTFAGITTRKEALLLTVKSRTDVRNRRIVLHRKASAHRWYLDFRLTKVSQVDRELMEFLRASYELSQ